MITISLSHGIYRDALIVHIITHLANMCCPPLYMFPLSGTLHCPGLATFRGFVFSVCVCACVRVRACVLYIYIYILMHVFSEPSGIKLTSKSKNTPAVFAILFFGED